LRKRLIDELKVVETRIAELEKITDRHGMRFLLEDAQELRAVLLRVAGGAA
jgi:hypothetical protein